MEKVCGEVLAESDARRGRVGRREGGREEGRNFQKVKYKSPQQREKESEIRMGWTFSRATPKSR